MVEIRNSRQPLVMCRLWEKTSAKSRIYIAGRLGGAKVLLMPVRERDSEEGPTHELLLIEADQREGGAA
jgi:hypothetical protein